MSHYYKVQLRLAFMPAQYISIYSYKETSPPDKQSTIIMPPAGEHALSKPFRQSHVAFDSPTIVFSYSLNQLVELKTRNKVSFRSFFTTGTPNFYFETSLRFVVKHLSHLWNVNSGNLPLFVQTDVLACKTENQNAFQQLMDFSNRVLLTLFVVSLFQHL